MGLHGPVKKPRLDVVKGAKDKNIRKMYMPEQPPAYIPAEPDWASLLGSRSRRLIADAHAEWELTVGELQRRGILTRTDVSTVIDYCVCHARVLQCERRLSREGFIVPGANGPVKNPVAQLLAQWRQSLQRHRTDLGLSPMGRARLGREEQPPPTDDSDLDGEPPV